MSRSGVFFCRRCSGVESEQQWVSLLTELQEEALANTPPHTLSAPPV